VVEPRSRASAGSECLRGNGTPASKRRSDAYQHWQSETRRESGRERAAAFSLASRQRQRRRKRGGLSALPLCSDRRAALRLRAARRSGAMAPSERAHVVGRGRRRRGAAWRLAAGAALCVALLPLPGARAAPVPGRLVVELRAEAAGGGLATGAAAATLRRALYGGEPWLLVCAEGKEGERARLEQWSGALRSALDKAEPEREVGLLVAPCGAPLRGGGSGGSGGAQTLQSLLGLRREASGLPVMAWAAGGARAKQLKAKHFTSPLPASAPGKAEGGARPKGKTTMIQLDAVKLASVLAKAARPKVSALESNARFLDECLLARHQLCAVLPVRGGPASLSVAASKLLAAAARAYRFARFFVLDSSRFALEGLPVVPPPNNLLLLRRKDFIFSGHPRHLGEPPKKQTGVGGAIGAAEAEAAPQRQPSQKDGEHETEPKRTSQDASGKRDVADAELLRAPLPVADSMFPGGAAGQVAIAAGLKSIAVSATPEARADAFAQVLVSTGKGGTWTRAVEAAAEGSSNDADQPLAVLVRERGATEGWLLSWALPKTRAVVLRVAAESALPPRSALASLQEASLRVARAALAGSSARGGATSKSKSKAAGELRSKSRKAVEGHFVLAVPLEPGGEAASQTLRTALEGAIGAATAQHVFIPFAKRPAISKLVTAPTGPKRKSAGGAGTTKAQAHSAAPKSWGAKQPKPTAPSQREREAQRRKEMEELERKSGAFAMGADQSADDAQGGAVDADDAEEIFIDEDPRVDEDAQGSDSDIDVGNADADADKASSSAPDSDDFDDEAGEGQDAGGLEVPDAAPPPDAHAPGMTDSAAHDEL
jgi:hypothetical protein